MTINIFKLKEKLDTITTERDTLKKKLIQSKYSRNTLPKASPKVKLCASMSKKIAAVGKEHYEYEDMLKLATEENVRLNILSAISEARNQKKSRV